MASWNIGGTELRQVPLALQELRTGDNAGGHVDTSMQDLVVGLQELPREQAG